VSVVTPEPEWQFQVNDRVIWSNPAGYEENGVVVAIHSDARIIRYDVELDDGGSLRGIPGNLLTLLDRPPSTRDPEVIERWLKKR
jgi:hypothetical protein